MSPTSALAQAVDLVTNTGQTVATGISPNSFQAQSFETGTEPTGYRISEIQVRTGPFSGTREASVTLREDNSGEPGDLVEIFTNPASITANALNTFTSPTASGTLVRADTPYWVSVHEGVSNKRAGLAQTNQDGQSGETGWSIGDGRSWRAAEANSWGTSNASLVIVIRGAVANTDATLSGLVLSERDGSAITLDPSTFDPATTEYAAAVRNGVEVITVEPTTADGGATVQYLDVAGHVIDDADANEDGMQIGLSVGVNLFRVKVTDGDGVTTETYTVVVERDRTDTGFLTLECRSDHVWCTTMRMVSAPSGYGYCRAGSGITNCGYGSVDRDDFTLDVDGTNYRVDSVRLDLISIIHPDGNYFDYGIFLTLDKDLPATRLGDLKLHFGQYSFDLADAERRDRFEHTSLDYRWKIPEPIFGVIEAHLGQRASLPATVQLSRTPNVPATGQPTVSGAARVGETLTVHTYGIVDANGLSGVAFEHQWVRVDGSTETDIAGATDATYAPVAADLGKTLKVRASFVDDAGYDEAVTSEATASVAGRMSAVAGDATLGSLELEYADGRAIALTPGFAALGTSYLATVGKGINGITVHAMPTDIGATVEYLDAGDTAIVDAEGAEDGLQAAVAVGANVIKVKVTSADGNATETYTVTVTAGSADASLAALRLRDLDGAAVSLAPGFAAGTTDYVAAVANDKDAITVDATTADDDAGVEYLNARDMVIVDLYPSRNLHQVPLAVGRNVIKMRVTAEDGVTTETYTVTVTREAPATTTMPSTTCPDNPGIWCTTLTVGSFAEDTGYCNGVVENFGCGYGSLGKDDFTLDTGYTVRSLRWDVFFPNTANNHVHLTLNQDLADTAGLVLWIGSHSFDLGEASRNTQHGTLAHNYRWSGVPDDLFDLFPGHTVTVQLVGPYQNSLPVFEDGATATRGVDENTAPGTPFGRVVTATDADGDALAYGLAGPDAARFAIDPATGKLRTAAPLDHESAASHLVTVTADDGKDTTSADVTVNVNDVDEQSARPDRPLVTAASGTTRRLDVSWAAPDRRGGPVIVDYLLEYRIAGQGSWIEWPDPATGTSLTLTGLTADTEYAVRVQARNGETPSEVSPVGRGKTLGGTNTAATGAPAIEGRTLVGQTLSVDVSGIEDEDGLAAPDYGYQWERVVGGAGSGIPGATRDLYRVTAEDDGKELRVRVSFTDDGGVRETLTSAAVGPVGQRQAYCAVPNLAGRIEIWRGNVTISAYADGSLGLNAFEGEFFGIIEADPFSMFSYGPGNTSYGIEIFGATENSGLLIFLDRILPADARAALRLHVCDRAFDLSAAELALDSNNMEATGKVHGWQHSGLDLSPFARVSVALSVRVPPNVPATGAPGITGAATVGETLTADTSGIADDNGLDNVEYDYQWIRLDADGAGNPRDIPGATGKTYTPVPDDAGKTLKVAVTFTDDHDYDEGPLTSGATLPVIALPGAPTALAATVDGPTMVGLSWMAPAENGGSPVTGYRIEVSTDAGLTWSDAVADTGSPDTAWSHTGLFMGGTRHYRVSAINAAGAGEASATASVTTTPVTVEREVPADWPLKPDAVVAGGTFRLLFVSQAARDGSSNDIAVYNSHVQSAAASGHADIQQFSADFTALASTEAVNARANTLTTATVTDAPIYWVHQRGQRNAVANDYADFYDGTWINDNPRNQSGAVRTFGAVLTGSSADGATGANPLGHASMVGVWSIVGKNIETGTLSPTATRPVLGLSPVFRVAGGAPTAADATLSALGLTDADGAAVNLNETFSPGAFDYTADAASDVSKITVEATPAVAGVMVEFLDGDDAAITDADGDDTNGFQAALAAGDTVIKVKVTATDGRTILTYAVTVTRLATDDATLRALALTDADGAVDLNETFAPSTTDYTASVAMEINEITIEATPADANATVAYLDAAAAALTDADDTADGFQVALGLEETVIKARVTAEDGNTTGDYTLTVTRMTLPVMDEQEVAGDWALKPDAVGPGEAFRLLFLSTTTRDGSARDIAVYNSHVRNAAALGHADIRAYATAFTAIGSTQAVDARANTLTRAGDTDAPIYWVHEDGARSAVADDYADFYDAAWANTQVRTESGAGTTQNLALTGSDTDGSKYSSRELGRSTVGYWRINSDGTISFSQGNNSSEIFVLGLSPIFRVDTDADANDATLSGLALTDAGGAVDLNETFDPSTKDYTASVTGAGEITIEATPADDNATVAYLDAGDAALTDADGNVAGLQTTLAAGETVIKARVTAEDGNTTDTYSLTITVTDDCPTGRKDSDWCATLTVGTNAGGSGDAYGFRASGTQIGMLDVEDIDYGGDDELFKVRELRIWDSDSGTDNMVIRFRNTDGHAPPGTVFNFGGSLFAVDDSLKQGDAEHEWTLPADLSWAVDQQVTVSVEFGNFPATGGPAVSGTPQVGHTLSADTSGIADVDGKTQADNGDVDHAYGYQWVRLDADGMSDPQDLAGATGNTYVLVEDDVGKTLKVRVSFTDDADNLEENLTSAATAAVAALAEDCEDDRKGNNWCATLTVGTNRGASGDAYGFRASSPQIGMLDEEDIDYGGDDELFKVRELRIWDSDDGANDHMFIRFRNDDGRAPPGTVFNFGGTLFTADDSMKQGDAGHLWTLPDGLSWAVGQTVTVSVELGNFPATGQPVVSGTPQVGHTLSTDTSGIADVDGKTQADNGDADHAYEYQWVRLDADGTSDPEDLTGATYDPVAADVGKTLKVRVSFTDDDDNEESGENLTSAATAAVARAGAGNDATLSGLELSDAADAEVRFIPRFAPETTEYAAEVALETVQITIEATPTDDGAAIKYLDAADVAISDQDGSKDGHQAPLVTGANVIKLKVTAENGLVTETYTLTVTVTDNRAPTISSNKEAFPAYSIEEHELFQDFLFIGDPDTDDDVTDVTLGGADSARFIYGAGNSNRLEFKDSVFPDSRPNFEDPRDAGKDNEYNFTITVTSEGSAGDRVRTAQQQVTVTVTDKEEPPGKPTELTVTPSPLAARLLVTWKAPEKSGGPAIAAYDVEYCAGATADCMAASDFTSHDHTGTGTSTTIAGLSPGTTYQVRVRASHHEGTSGWSERVGATTFADDVLVETPTLVSNLEQPPGQPADVRQHIPTQTTYASLYQYFKTGTGTDVTGYRLDAVFIDVESVPDDPNGDLEFIRVGTVKGTTFTPLYDFEIVSGRTRTTGVKKYTGPANVVLAKNRQYALRIKANPEASTLQCPVAPCSGGFSLHTTSTGAEDTSSAAGWRINNAGPISTYPLRFGLSGSAVMSTPPTGKPAITGTAQVGLTLTADVSGIADADGTTRADDGDVGYAYTYQWVRLDADGTSNPVDITGATGKTYVPVPDDVGKTLKVRVSFKDDADTVEGPLSSDPTAVVTAAEVDNATLSSLTLSGLTLVPAFSSATTDYTADVTNAVTRTTVTVVTANPNALVVYLDGADAPLTDADGDDTNGFQVDLAVGENVIKIKVTSEDTSTTKTYTVTVTRAAGGNTPATGKPAITGTARVGATLTADPSGIADVDGKTKADDGDAGYAYTYQWVRVDGADETDITGATGKTYVLMADDLGKTLKVRVSFTDDADNLEEMLTSDPTAAVTAAVAPTVAGVAFTTLPGDDIYDLGEIIEVSVTFSEEVVVDTAGGTPRVPLRLAGFVQYADFESAPITATVLVFRLTLDGTNDDDTNGIQVLENTLALNGGTIRNAADTVDANLDHAGMTGLNTRTRLVEKIAVTSTPSVTGFDPAVYGPDEKISFTVTFGDAVTVNTANPPILKFWAFGDSTAKYEAAYAEGSGTTALRFDWTVPESVDDAPADVSVRTNHSSTGVLTTANGLQNGGGLTDSGDRVVNVRHGDYSDLVIVDTAPPVLLSDDEGATVDGADLVLAYRTTDASTDVDPLDTGSTPAVGDYAVTAVDTDGVSHTHTVSKVEVKQGGGTVRLTLGAPVAHGDVVTLDYTPGANPVRDLWQNAAVLLDDRAVRNDTQALASDLPWSTAMRVGETTAPARGFNEFTGGTLNDAKGFQYLGEIHKITILDRGDVTNDDEAVYLYFNQEMPARGWGPLVLEWAGESLPLTESSATISLSLGSERSFYCTSDWLATDAPKLSDADWKTTLPIDGVVPVCIRTTSQTCPVNNPAAGVPAIEGRAQVGETLTADISGIGDADGKAGADAGHTGFAYGYAWFRDDGVTETAVGTDSPTYTVVAADVGKTLKVKVRFADDAGNAEGPLASDPTAPVMGLPVTVTTAACTATGLGDDRASVWSGTVTVGSDSHVVTLGDLVHQGYSTVVLPLISTYGMLDVTGFEYRGTNYTIEALRQIRQENSGVFQTSNLSFFFENEPVSAVSDRMTLHVGTDSFAFMNATHVAGERGYTWSNSFDSWPDGSSVEFCITAKDVPLAPTALTATADGETRIDLAWTAPSDDGGPPITGYRIEVSTDAGANWTDLIADTGDTDTTYAHTTGLTAGTTRHYRVSAVNEVGDGAASGTANATTAVAVPGAPQNLAATAGDTEVTLTWEAPSNNGGADIDKYQYRHSTGATVTAGATWTDHTGADLEETVTGLTNGTQYAFEVRAVNSAGEGAAAADTATPVAAVTVPGAPQNLVAAAGDREVALTWEAPADDGGGTVTGYEYRYQVGTTVTTGTWTDAGTDLAETVTGLTNGTEYAFEVRAKNSAGDGAAATDTAEPRPVVSIADVEFEEDAGAKSVTVTLSAASVKAVEVLYSANNLIAEKGKDYAFTNDTLTIPAGDTSGAVPVTIIDDDIDEFSDLETFTILLAGPVNAVFKGGGVTLEATISIKDNDTRGVSVSTATLSVPEDSHATYTVVLDSQPTGTVTVTPALETGGDGDLTLASTMALSFTVSNWNVEQSVQVNAAEDPDILHGTATIAHTVGGAGTDYVGETAASVTVTEADNDSAVTVPDAPTNLTATASPGVTRDNDIALAWTAPGDNGGSAVTGYRIEVSVDAGANWTDRVDDTDTTAVAYTHTGVPGGATRHYRVSAINSEGTGAASGVANATTETPVVSLDKTSFLASEENTYSVEFTVVLENSLGRPSTADSDVSVGYATADGTATAGDDYTAATATLTLSAGNDEAYFEIVILDDTEVEETETFTVTLSNPVGATLGADIVGTVQITNVENSPATGMPVVKGTPQVGATLTADISGIMDADGLTFYSASTIYQWLRVDGADETEVGSDSATYTVAAADVGKTIKVRVTVYDDTENWEDPIDSATVGPVTAAVTVPGPPQNLTATAGDNKVELRWEAPADDGGSAVTGYQFRFANGATVPDLTSWSSPADLLSIDFTSGMNNGELYAFEVRAVNGTGEGAAATATAEPRPVISIADVSFGEDAGVTSVTVTLSARSAKAVSVVYLETPGTAELDDDYTFTDSTLTIPVGATSGAIPVTIIDDDIDENDETFEIGLLHPVNAVLQDDEDGDPLATSAEVTITDNDTRGVIVGPTKLSVPEDGNASYTVELNTQPTDTVTVTPALESGGDADLTLASTTALNFTVENWDEPQSVQVNAAEDADAAHGTAKILHTVAGADYASETAASVTVTEADNDAASTTVTLSVDPAEVDEDAGATTVTVTGTLDGAARTSATAVTVSVGASSDSAVEGADYETVADFALTIGAGQSTGTATFTLTPEDDAIDDDAETLTVSGTVAGLTVVAAAVTIADNDEPVAPTVTDVAFTNLPADNVYDLGETIEVSVTFSEPVTVDTTGGTPRVHLSFEGAVAQYAAFESVPSTAKVLVFRYTLDGTTDNDTAGIDVVPNGLELNGGTILNAADTADANLDHGAVTGLNTRTRLVENIEVTSTPAVTGFDPGVYGPGEEIEFTVTFKDAVSVVEADPPVLEINAGSTFYDAAYVGGTGTTALRFEWTVPTLVDGDGPANVDVRANHQDTLLLAGRGLQDGGGLTDAGGRAVNVRHEKYNTLSIVDTAPPVLRSADDGATVNGDALVLTYRKTATSTDVDPLDSGSTPAPGDYAVTAAGAALDVSGARVMRDGAVWLTLSAPVCAADPVALDYTPGTDPVRDLRK